MERAQALLPYCGAPPAPGHIWLHWNFDPALLGVFVMTAALWLVQRRDRARSWSFWAGYGALILAFVSPLCALSSGLFSARSVHHLILVAIAAPLLGYALRVPRVPIGLAAALHVMIFWGWHLPDLYAAALSSHFVYWAMQISLLGSGILFWSLLYRSASIAAALGALAAVMVQMGLLGAILTFAPRALYVPHYLTTQIYGLAPLEDQQLAGLIMWVASLPLYLVAAAPLLVLWLGRARQAAA